MTNHYEELAKTIAKQSAQDQRAQPWKHSIDTNSPAPAVEWIKVNEETADSSSASESESSDPEDKVKASNSTVDVRTNLF